MESLLIPEVFAADIAVPRHGNAAPRHTVPGGHVSQTSQRGQVREARQGP